jgi:hypothetical protein
VEIAVLKHWHDPSWSEPHLPVDELVLAEYSLCVPLLMRWSGIDDQITIEAMRHALMLKVDKADQATGERRFRLQ